MENDLSSPHPDTVLVPAENGRPAITQAELERVINDLSAVEGRFADLCVYSAALIGMLAGRIHRAGLAPRRLSTETERPAQRLCTRQAHDTR
jgi:hypothetical protein